MRRWSALHDVAVPALVVSVEAAWLSIWLGALAHAGPAGASRLPAIAVVLPAACSAAVAGLSSRLAGPRYRRVVVVAVAAVAGVALSVAGLTSLLDGSLAGWLAHLWVFAGHPAQGEQGLAWFVALAAWGRGTWAAWEEPRAGAVAASAAVGGAAFALFFVVDAAERHHAGWPAETLPATVLLLLAVPAAIAAVALVNERDLERWQLRRASPRPSLAWLAALLVPLLVVAALALVVGLAGGPLAPAIERLALLVGRGIGALLDALARLLGGLLHVRVRARTMPLHGSAGGAKLPRLGPSRPLPGFVTALAVALGALAAAAVLAVLARLLVRLVARLRLRAAPVQPAGEEERDSLFSWRHLLEQVRAALLALAARLVRLLRLRVLLRRGREQPGAVGPAGDGEPAGSGRVFVGVRFEYRRVLAATRDAGVGRLPAETPLELGHRLATLPAFASGGAVSALDRLTSLYHLARYSPGAGERAPEPSEIAAGLADLVVASLLPPAVPEPAELAEPDPEPEPEPAEPDPEPEPELSPAPDATRAYPRTGEHEGCSGEP